MAKKFDFISNLEEDAKSPKTKFQLFEAEIGFEHAEILIPFDKADAFLEEAMIKKPKSKSSMLRLATQYGGEVK